MKASDQPAGAYPQPRCLVLRAGVAFDGHALSLVGAEDVYRGTLKHGLEHEDPAALADLFDSGGVRADGAPTNISVPGIALSVDEVRDTEGARGHHLTIKLFGRAHVYAPRVVWALAAGLAQGLGVRKTSARLVELQAYAGERGWQGVRMPMLSETALYDEYRYPADFLGAVALPARMTQRMGIAVRKRMRLLVEKKPLSTAPEFNFLFGRILERANRVATRWGNGVVLAGAERDRLLDLARHVRLDEKSGVVPTRRVVRSARQESKYPGDGLAGTIWYRVDDARIWDDLLPWLFAARVLHVGQQTTIGLGGFDILFDSGLDGDQA